MGYKMSGIVIMPRGVGGGMTAVGTPLPATGIDGETYVDSATGIMYTWYGAAWHGSPGVAGPAGPTGATGATGATGPAGPGTALTLTAEPSNQAYTGETIQLTYGESLVPGDVVYIKSDGAVWKADANGAGTYPAVGIAVETASSGTHGVLLRGIYRDDSLYNWTVGGVLYLSTTAGGLTQTQPSATDDVIQIMGIATHADRAYIRPDLVWITHI